MKTGLILEGGNLRTAFTCGVLHTLADAGVQFTYTVATGAATLAAAYYHAGQTEALESLYGNYFAKHGELKRREALRGEQAIRGSALLASALETTPFDMDAFAGGIGILEIATTRANNGDGVFWNVSGVSQARALAGYLQGALAWPGVDAPVGIVEQSYYDGSIAEPLPVHAALEEGCDRVVVVRTHPEDIHPARHHASPLMRLAMREQSDLRNAYQLSHLHCEDELALLDKLKAQGRALVVAPLVESTHYRRYGVSRSAASEFYTEGMRLTEERLATIKRFLGMGA